VFSTHPPLIVLQLYFFVSFNCLNTGHDLSTHLEDIMKMVVPALDHPAPERATSRNV
jgi:hypothetical protein